MVTSVTVLGEPIYDNLKLDCVNKLIRAPRGLFKTNQDAFLVSASRLPEVYAVIPFDDWLFIRVVNFNGGWLAVFISVTSLLLCGAVIASCLFNVLRKTWKYLRSEWPVAQKAPCRLPTMRFVVITHALLMISVSLLVILLMVLAVKAAIALENWGGISGCIYYASIFTLATPIIPELSEWIVAVARGKILGGVRDFIVSLTALITATKLISSLFRLICSQDFKNWERWRDLINAFYEVLT